MLIGLSVWLFHSAVSRLNLFGYFIAFLAVCWYNYQKLQAAKGVVAANGGSNSNLNGGNGSASPSSSSSTSAEERIPLKVLSATGFDLPKQQIA
jgi:hypothetical protein